MNEHPDDATDSDQDATEPEAASTDEPTCTESRFDRLLDHPSAVSEIVAATREFTKSAGVDVAVLNASGDAPALKSDAGFRYADQYQPFLAALRAGEEVTIVTVARNDEVLAYGFGEIPTKDGVEIMTIDVAPASRRSADMKHSVQLHNESFEIGIGHVLALGLIDSIPASIVQVNATTPQARYIFKSLGFVSRSESNSCLLRLQKTE